MISYFDTSALIKKYVKEKGTDEVIKRWNGSKMLVVSSVAYAEFFSAMNRKMREGVLLKKELKSAIQNFKSDWESLIKVEVIDTLNKRIEELTTKYPLRGFDAIHLASALYFQNAKGEELNFICADHRLNNAAQQENLKVIDVS